MRIRPLAIALVVIVTVSAIAACQRGGTQAPPSAEGGAAIAVDRADFTAATAASPASLRAVSAAGSDPCASAVDVPMADNATGEPTSPATVLRAAIGDDRALHLRVRCPEHRMQSIRANIDLMGKGVWADDYIEILLDPTGTGRGSFSLYINTNGICEQLVHGYGDDHERPWSSLAAVSVQRGSDGWTIEAAVPLDALAEPEIGMPWGDHWRINVFRARPARNDEPERSWALSPTLAPAYRVFERMARLDGVRAPVYDPTWRERARAAVGATYTALKVVRTEVDSGVVEVATEAPGPVVLTWRKTGSTEVHRLERPAAAPGHVDTVTISALEPRSVYLVSVSAGIGVAARSFPDVARLVTHDEIVGPMVGHVDCRSARIWVSGPADRTLAIAWGVDGQPQAGTQVIAPDPRGHGTIVVLDGLAAATSYRYQVSLDGRAEPRWSGAFATPPEPGTHGAFTLAFTSCMKVQEWPSQPAWIALGAQKPALHLILGDTVYADTVDAKKQWALHQRQRWVPEFADAIRVIPTYAVWDDHDFGPNDSDGTLPGKEQSLATFQQIFANPSYGTATTPGLFTSFSWGDVDVFLLDGRYHRSPDDAPDDETKHMLGDEQFAWLEQQLAASHATFKILASGSTLHASSRDGWRIYSHERQRLFDLVRKKRIPGILYLSGDVHRCMIERMDPADTGGCVFYDLVSSGIAYPVEQDFVTIAFDTAGADPTATARIIHADGSIAQERVIPLSELTPK